MVGPFAGAAIILVVAALGGFHHILWLIAFLGAFRVVQDYVLSPNLLSEGMELHPLLVIFGVLAGASIGGVAGSFLSVPLLASLRIVFKHLQTSRADASAYRQITSAKP
jgi:predicted PurR-regulated permease PerM